MHFVDHDLHHLLADEFLLGVLGVAGGSHLLGGSLGEANAEQSQQVAINSLALHECFNEGVPFLDEGT